MSEIKIITNGHLREILYWQDLTQEDRKEFDNYDATGSEFVRYKGEVYDLGEFERAGERFEGWDGYKSDTVFSGVLVRWPREDLGWMGTGYDPSHVVMGWFYC